MKYSLNTIILFVQNIERMQQFYTDYFHAEVVETWGDSWVLLNTGGCQIGLHVAGAVYQPAGGEGNNVKLVFETDDDLERLHERLQQPGLTLGGIKSYEGYPYLLFEGADPEGNVFQVQQKK